VSKENEGPGRFVVSFGGRRVVTRYSRISPELLGNEWSESR